jgi:nucleotide-binding universal stress UspA family protein
VSVLESAIASVLVGTDGSDAASVAVARAIELARGLGARLQIVSAYSPVSEGGPRVAPARGTVPALWPTNQRDAALGVLTAAEREASVAGVGQVETFARVGDAADAILDVAEEQGCDLIVVGNKGMTGATRFLLGSVPNKVSHHAPCSVMIVRAG